jgi:hypothetical protein
VEGESHVDICEFFSYGDGERDRSWEGKKIRSDNIGGILLQRRPRAGSGGVSVSIVVGRGYVYSRNVGRRFRSPPPPPLPPPHRGRSTPKKQSPRTRKKEEEQLLSS